MPTPTKSEEKKRVTVDNYTFNIRDKIGSGFSSTVYRGTNTKNGETVAVKVINLRTLKDPLLKHLLESQIQVLKSVNHPNLLRCVDVSVTHNNCYIITQFCNQPDLGTQLLKKRRYSQEQGLPLIKQICEGYLELRNSGIIHRDIKPANIFMADGVPKIGDFGFAKFDNCQYKQKVSVGSPIYMSPQALLDCEYSSHNDIWGLGVLFYEMLQGRTPWEVRSQKELKKVIKSKFIFRVAIRPELEQLINQCLTVEQENRISIEGILHTINSLLGSKGCSMQMPETARQSKLTAITEEQQPSKVLKTIINLNRFIYKLYGRIRKISCSHAHRSTIQNQLLRFLKESNRIMVGFIEDQNVASGYGLSFKDFRDSSMYSNFYNVIKQYNQRYTNFLSEKQKLQYHSPLDKVREAQTDIPTKLCTAKLKSILPQLELSGVENWQHNIAVDFLVTLTILADRFNVYGFGSEFINIKIHSYLEIPPEKLGEDDLEELRLRVREIC